MYAEEKKIFYQFFFTFFIFFMFVNLFTKKISGSHQRTPVINTYSRKIVKVIIMMMSGFIYVNVVVVVVVGTKQRHDIW